jgi:hypothetical protein
MAKNVIDLFPSFNQGKYSDKKYSSLLYDFFQPFQDKFPEDFSMEEVIDFGRNAWNLGGMSLIMPEEDFKKVIAKTDAPAWQRDILNEMITLKREKYAKYDLFIADFSLDEIDDEMILTVACQKKEAFIQDMMENHDQTAYEEGYINRFAVTLKPKKPFFDWLNALYPDDPIHEIDEVKTYLIQESDDFFQDWLKKKYDRFFMAELYDWHENKKEWPRKRSYKMFREWFQVEVSTMVYDFERQPVLKNDY